MSLESASPQHWVGRKRLVKDHVSDLPVLRMAATFGWDAPPTSAGSPLPPLWHWLFGAPATPAGNLGEDGHERLGLFMPELPPSVRMWAAGDVNFIDTLRIGDAVEIESEVISVEAKQGRTGHLWFVVVAHHYRTERGIAVEERQTLVYRPENNGRQGLRRMPEPAPSAPELARYRADDLQLLRYSSLTFNSHRIHFDRRYCEAAEGDARLVVHGPLLATILARAAKKLLSSPLASFSFRALHPTREGEEFAVRATTDGAASCRLWIVGADGSARMSAHASG